MALTRLTKHCTKPSFQTIPRWSPLRAVTGLSHRAPLRSALNFTGIRLASVILGSDRRQISREHKAASIYTRKAHFSTSLSSKWQSPYGQYRLAQYPSDYTSSVWRRMSLLIWKILKWLFVNLVFCFILYKAFNIYIRRKAMVLGVEAYHFRSLLNEKYRLETSFEAQPLNHRLSDPGSREQAIKDIRLRILEHASCLEERGIFWQRAAYKIQNERDFWFDNYLCQKVAGNYMKIGWNSEDPSGNLELCVSLEDRKVWTRGRDTETMFLQDSTRVPREEPINQKPLERSERYDHSERRAHSEQIFPSDKQE